MSWVISKKYIAQGICCNFLVGGARTRIMLTNIQLHINKLKSVGPRQWKASLVSVKALRTVSQQCETNYSVLTAFLLYTIINHWEQFYYSYYLVVVSFVVAVLRYFVLFTTGSTNECLFIIVLCCLNATVQPLGVKQWMGFGEGKTLLFELLGSSKRSTAYLFQPESRIGFN